MDSDLLVIGHSFVKQLQVSVLRRGCTTQIVGADLGVSAQFSSVFTTAWAVSKWMVCWPSCR